MTVLDFPEAAKRQIIARLPKRGRKLMARTAYEVMPLYSLTITPSATTEAADRATASSLMLVGARGTGSRGRGRRGGEEVEVHVDYAAILTTLILTNQIFVD